MFGSLSNGANAYAKVGVETGVSAASPHKLILMLFEGAIVSVANAQQHMKAGNIAAKGQAISKAISIIEGGLRASLDKNAGGDIANNLDALYLYMNSQLVKANIEGNLAMLEEVHKLLKELNQAWAAIGDNANSAPAAEPPKTPAYDPLAPHTFKVMKA